MKQNSLKQKILDKIDYLQSRKINSKTWNISYLQGKILSEFILLNNPKKVLELGTSNGFSTLFLSLNLASTSNIFTYEIDTSRCEIARNLFNEIGLSNVKVCNCDFLDLLRKKELNEIFDFFFIDACQKNYLEIFNLIIDLNLAEKNSILIFDNILSHDYMNNFLNQIKIKKYNFDILDVGGGFLIIFL